jgi:hypothetical protein
MHSRIASSSALTVCLLPYPLCFRVRRPLSPEAIREAYFLGQHNDQSTLSFFNQHLCVLPKPATAPTSPKSRSIRPTSRLSRPPAAQQAEQDYRPHRDKLYVRVRINFTETYGALELYRSAKSDREHSGAEQSLPDFYCDFRVGLSQRSGSSHKEQWIEPLSVILQPSFTQTSNHHPFIPEDLGLFSYAATDASSYAYSNVNGFVYPTGWLVWLVYDASDVASDDATVEVTTTDGQHISVPYDLSRLR